jgi:hypothetical protein
VGLGGDAQGRWLEPGLHGADLVEHLNEAGVVCRHALGDRVAARRHNREEDGLLHVMVVMDLEKKRVEVG